MINFTNEQIDHETLPHLDVVDLLPLETAYKKVMYLNALPTLMAPIAWAIAFFVFGLQSVPWLAILLVLPAILLPAASIALVAPSFRVKRFAIREKDIIYQSGLIFRSLTVTPFNRVQHCEINRGPVSRILGLSELNIFTAGGMSSDISIPGLSEHTAAQLCRFVLEKIKQSDEEE